MESSDPEDGKKYVSSAYIFSFAVAAIIIAVVVILSGIVKLEYNF